MWRKITWNRKQRSKCQIARGDTMTFSGKHKKKKILIYIYAQHKNNSTWIITFLRVSFHRHLRTERKIRFDSMNCGLQAYAHTSTWRKHLESRFFSRRQFVWCDNISLSLRLFCRISHEESKEKLCVWLRARNRKHVNF